MVRKYSVLILGVILGVAILASTSWAQPPGGRQGRGMGPMGGGGAMGLLALLNNEKVQKELELVDDQKTKLKTLGEETRTAMMESFGALRDLSDEERGPKMEQLMKENQEKTQKKLAEILMPNQLVRIKQIQLQAEGAMALLNNSDVAKELVITDEQKKKLTEIRDELMTKMREARQEMQGLSQEERQAKMAKMRTDQNAKLMEVLTQEQRDKFEKMKGEKVDIDFSTLMGPGMGRGPRGGRGQGGGGSGGGQGN
jgi:hypothetical protein